MQINFINIITSNCGPTENNLWSEIINEVEKKNEQSTKGW